MPNEAVETTFRDTLTCDSAKADDNKKYEIYLLIHNVFLFVVKVGKIQAIIGRLAERALLPEYVLENIGKRLSESFFDNDEIITVLFERRQYK